MVRKYKNNQEKLDAMRQAIALRQKWLQAIREGATKEEMEKMGYDMSEYKNPEKIGGATAEEREAAKKEALMKDRSVKKAGDFIEKSDKAPDEYNTHVMRACGEVDGRPNCNRDCKHCMRRHCPYRQE